MSLRKYDNSNSPRLVTQINDGGVTPNVAPTGDRILVLGFCNNTALNAQELFPTVEGGASSAVLLQSTYNQVTVTVNGEDVIKYYPSELSNQVEELLNSGSANIQVIKLGEDDRMRDMSAPMATERYIALENAYESIADIAFDRIVPCNVIAGLKGDGRYNASTLEVVYDKEEYDAIKLADPLDADIALSSVDGFLKISDAATLDKYTKPITSGGEDLVYQLASICFRITTNGNLCTGIHRTVSPVELRYLTSVDLTSGTGAVGTDFGSGVGEAAILPNVWAFAKDYNVAAKGGLDFAGADSALSAAATLEAINASASMVDVATGNLKAIYLEDTDQNYTTGGTVTLLEEIAWQLAYGKAVVTSSVMNTWINYLSSFGTEVKARLMFNGASIISYLELDPVTSADQEIPDNYRLFLTTTNEVPSNYTDPSIVLDANKKPVDMGYLLDRVAANSVFTPTFFGMGKTARTFSSVAGIGQILGWYNNLPNNVANTMQTTSAISEMGVLSSKAASDFTRKGYQLFTNRDSQYTFSRDITAGLFISNFVRTIYINRFTVSVLKGVLDVAGIEGRKLLGKLDGSLIKGGLQQRLEQEFARWAHPEDGRLQQPATVEVLSADAGGVLGKVITKIGLKIANEILEVNTVATVEQ